MDRTIYFVTVSFLLSVATVAHAHPGRTDANGGHHNRKTGGYHYHGGGSSTPAPRFTPRTTVRTEPRTTVRTAARSAATEPVPTLTPQQVRANSANEKLQAVKECLESSRATLRDLAENYDGTPAHRDAVELLLAHNLGEIPDERIQQEQEQAATNKLTLAKNALRDDKPGLARKWLNEVISDYPGTEAAAESKELLDGLR